MSSALLPRCPTRSPQPSFAATVGSSALILPMPRRQLRCGGVFCCSNRASSPRTTVDGPGFGGDFYELLGIRQDGSFDEIKQAYKRMALKYHPDVSPPNCTDQYTQHFIGLKKAYETLSDPVTQHISPEDSTSMRKWWSNQDGEPIGKISLKSCKGGA